MGARLGDECFAVMVIASHYSETSPQCVGELSPLIPPLPACCMGRPVRRGFSGTEIALTRGAARVPSGKPGVLGGPGANVFDGGHVPLFPEEAV
jgi:hypothetical protein